MTTLDFKVALEDRRLAPLTQLVALAALDGAVLPSHCDPLTVSRVCLTALAHSCCGEDNADLEQVCGAILLHLGMRCDALRDTIEEWTLTPQFITRSADKNGLLAERRLLAQLKMEQQVARHILSTTLPQ
ncbi:hypothetical protein DQ04_00571170 [Trypanosoma grayi]|uniref:hypothetical protein n=1 Tax=Trypanosoma grayi TaxID=71804 RepID=UPI0004F463C6|nr:hypothetical protein DQ04_00571170 [Trypanosoma grayi]KEG14222.1 hypothetical protein DQ04_00571170 [Trypanosoma grayi]